MSMESGLKQLESIDFNGLIMMGVASLAIFGVILLVIYILLGIILTKLNKKMYGKGTALAWVPFCNIYLLGKLTFNKIVGFVLLGYMILGSNLPFSSISFTNKVDNLTHKYSISTFVIIFFCFFGYAIFKNAKLKKVDQQDSNEIKDIINTNQVNNGGVNTSMSVMDNGVQPVASPVSASVMDNVVQQPVVPPVNDSVMNNVVQQPVVPPVSEPVMNNVVQQPIVVPPVSGTVVNNVVQQPIVSPVSEPVVNNVVQQPVVPPVSEPVMNNVVIPEIVQANDNGVNS